MSLGLNGDGGHPKSINFFVRIHRKIDASMIKLIVIICRPLIGIELDTIKYKCFH